jgi:carbonic anhydrase
LKTGANDYKRYSSREDAFTKSYTNQKKDVEILYADKMTTKVALEDGPNGFTSNIASSVFGASKSFSALQFHFHAGSEHTVNGKRHDLELHTVHVPADGKALNGFDYAAVGIMFSVNDYTAKLTAAE